MILEKYGIHFWKASSLKGRSTHQKKNQCSSGEIWSAMDCKVKVLESSSKGKALA